MNITTIDNYYLVDYLPIGKTIFDYYIRKTSKCDNISGSRIGTKVLREQTSCNGFEWFLERCQELNQTTIKVQIQNKDSNGIYVDVFREPFDCEIKEYGLSIPQVMKNWFEEQFIYSYITYVTRESFTKNPLEFSKKIVVESVWYEKSNGEYPKNFSPKNHPIEIIEVLYDQMKQILLIRPFLKITPDNFLDKLNEKHIATMIGYLYKNMNSLKIGDSSYAPSSLKQQFSFLAKCHPWMTAEQYKNLGQTEKNRIPGIYTLFKNENESNDYYTGKAIDMSTRIIAPQEKGSGICTVGHPLGDKEYKQFSEVRFDAFQFNDFITFCNLYQKEIEGKTDHKAEDAAFSETVLYAIEGVVNHIVHLALTKISDAQSVNTQFDEAHKFALSDQKIKK